MGCGDFNCKGETRYDGFFSFPFFLFLDKWVAV